MPIFQYTALSPAGKTKKGIVDADTAKDARQKLRTDRIHVTDMREISRRAQKKKSAGAAGKLFDIKSLRLEKRVNVRDLATFTR